MMQSGPTLTAPLIEQGASYSACFGGKILTIFLPGLLTGFGLAVLNPVSYIHGGDVMMAALQKPVSTKQNMQPFRAQPLHFAQPAKTLQSLNRPVHPAAAWQPSGAWQLPQPAQSRQSVSAAAADTQAWDASAVGSLNDDAKVQRLKHLEEQT